MSETEGARKRRLDLDALLQETALEVVIGGKTVCLTDVPVKAALRAAEHEGKKADPEADWQFVKDILVASCVEETDRDQLIAILDGVGIRARHALTMSVLDFFEPSDLIQKLPLSEKLKAKLQIGLEQSPTTSTPTTFPPPTPE